jgi:hypothetical protein
VIRVSALLLVLASPALAAAPVWPPAGLYDARTIISGSGEATRTDAIVASFRRVLVKVAANPDLLDDKRVEPFEALAPGMVEDFAYQDRMGDMPHHDEQGMRDRPFDFVAHFDPAKIDAVLVLLGETPYRGPRPKLDIRIGVDDRGSRFPLTADAEADEQQRESLLAAADRLAVRVALPDSTRIAPPPAGATVLSGTLVWSEADFGWVGTWRLDWPGGMHAWSIRGVSFDEAFRDALGGSLRALARRGG